MAEHRKCEICNNLYNCRYIPMGEQPPPKNIREFVWVWMCIDCFLDWSEADYEIWVEYYKSIGMGGIKIEKANWYYY